MRKELIDTEKEIGVSKLKDLEPQDYAEEILKIENQYIRATVGVGIVTKMEQKNLTVQMKMKKKK